VGRRTSTIVLVALAAVSLTVFGVGAAFAASGGGYTPGNQNCQPGDSDYATPAGQTYPGCHDVQTSIESGQTNQGDVAGGNTHYADLGLDQEPLDPNTQSAGFEEEVGEPGYEASPHAGCLGVNTDGTGEAPASADTSPTNPGTAADDPSNCGSNPAGAGFEANYDYYQYYCPVVAMLGTPCEDTTPGTTTVTPATGTLVDYQPLLQNGLLLYFGADDNLDSGEHDGLGPYSAAADQNNNGATNGSSDGGGMTASITPQNAGNTPSLTNPEGLANYSFGMCADGICGEGTTQQQTVNHGCGAADANGQADCTPGTPQDANVYDYGEDDPSVQSEPYNCNSGDQNSTSEAQCGPGGMNSDRSHEPANENAEPGVQTYSDPDPSRSPALPAPLWPTPGIYVGPCGVYAGSPALPTASAIDSTPVGNGEGQVAIDPDPGAC
jgi:hypothetical protein